MPQIHLAINHREAVEGVHEDEALFAPENIGIEPEELSFLIDF